MPTQRELASLYMDRTRAELAALEAAGFLLAGNAFPAILLVKGAPGPAELAGAPLLSGPDGDALRAALDRLGYPEDAWAACSAFALNAGAPSRLPAQELAVAVEAFDPEAVVALDTPAARALQEAWRLAEPLPVGALTRVRGRRALALGGFEAALSAEGGKQAMWSRLKLLPPLPAPL